jgi:hypothetical protein
MPADGEPASGWSQDTAAVVEDGPREPVGTDLEAEPFTPAWHARHPYAWNGGAANWWRAASPEAVAGWLERAAAEPAASRVLTVDGQILDVGPRADGTRSVLVEGEADPGDWLPLGVFASAAKAEAEDPLAWQQLALGRDGALRGNHFDAISGVVQPITGSVDPRTRLASWTVGGPRGARFETSIAGLTEPQTPANMVVGGVTRPWTLVRLERAERPTLNGEPVELLPAP